MEERKAKAAAASSFFSFGKQLGGKGLRPLGEAPGAYVRE